MLRRMFLVATLVTVSFASALDGAEVSYWNFDNTFNDSTGTRNLTGAGATSFSTIAAPGVGGSASLDVSGGGNGATYDVLGTDAVSGPWSVALWARGNTGGNVGSFFGTRGPSDMSFDAKWDTGARIHGDIGSGGVWLTTAADVAFDNQANNWHHVAYSVTPTGYTIYGNGQFLASGSYGASTPLLFNSTHDIAVGANSTALGENFDGRVDEVHVYNHAISQAEVWALLQPANTTQISSLYNTGVNNAGVPLANGAADPHYALIAQPAPGGLSDQVLTSAGGFPIGPWLGDNSTSAWIAANGNADGEGPAGNYTWRTTFDLIGDPATSIIEGVWATDNGAVDILINGMSVGTGQLSSSHNIWTPFLIDSGFVYGINTLDFVVNNLVVGSPNPTGLRVQMTGFAGNLPPPSVAVPEPTSIALWLLVSGFVMVYVLRGKQRPGGCP